MPAGCHESLPEVLANIPANTTDLSLRFRDLPIIHDHAFTSIPSLKKLHLSNSKIFRLESQAFYGLTKLEYLDLRSNKISNLPHEIFLTVTIHSSQIQIDLAYNYICTLPSELFKMSPPFLHLSKAENMISCLLEGVFSDVVLLEDHGICLRDNLISYISAEMLQVAAASAAGFDYFDLSQNRITHLPANLTSLMPTFKRLFLYSNQIEFFTLKHLLKIGHQNT